MIRFDDCADFSDAEKPPSVGILAHRNGPNGFMEPKYQTRFVSVMKCTPNAHPLTFGEPGSLGQLVSCRQVDPLGPLNSTLCIKNFASDACALKTKNILYSTD